MNGTVISAVSNTSSVKFDSPSSVPVLAEREPVGSDSAVGVGTTKSGLVDELPVCGRLSEMSV